VQRTRGSQADIVYGIAACQYQLKEYTSVVNNCKDLVSSAVRNHPGTADHPRRAQAIVIVNEQLRSVEAMLFCL